MKLQYYFMSMALMATACVSFTACDDDDPVDEPVYVIPEQDKPDITLTENSLTIKIGAENKAPLPIEQAGEGVKAFSLNPEIVEIVTEGGESFIQAVKPGITEVVISDANGDYKNITVHSYEYQLTLNQNTASITTLFATPKPATGIKITSGNGGYTATSTNRHVTATIDEETGDVTVSGAAELDDYTATLTITDVSGLTADITVSVSTLPGGFTTAELAEIKAKTDNTLFASTTEPGDGPYYFPTYENYEGAQWTNATADGMHTLGWDIQVGEYEYGRETIIWPATAAVNQVVEGTLKYRHSTSQWYGLYDQSGQTQVLLDDETRIIVAWWYYNTGRDRLDRAYIVYNK